MKKQNNNPNYLKLLLRHNLITMQQYFFRLEAKKLNINTYKFILCTK